VLVIEDEENMRLALERLLVEAGHTVCLAMHGLAGIQQMLMERPDLVLLDMLLGPTSIDGWEVIRRMKRDPEIANIPMILVSGLSSKEIHARARVDDGLLSEIRVMLGKPVSSAQLRAAVSHIESLRKLEEETRS
jgi:CheY-like chemotaxis protein